MKIVVTTPTGNIGKALTGHLMEAGHEVVLPCRNPDKVEDFTRRGARAVKGSLEDQAYLTETLRGADALFWLTPPDFEAADFRAQQNRLGRAAAGAIRETKVPRVVNLSSVGGQHPAGTGPVKGLHDVEGLLNDAAENVTHVRAAFFFENFLAQIESIKTAGSIFLPVAGSTRIRMIATRDIARAAADRLMDTSWTGHSVMPLDGPADLSFDEAATAISEGIGREVKHVQAEEAQTRQMLLGMGASEDSAETMLELFRGIESGRVAQETPRSAESTTPTTLVTFAREVMAPMFA